MSIWKQRLNTLPASNWKKTLVRPKSRKETEQEPSIKDLEKTASDTLESIARFARICAKLVKGIVAHGIRIIVVRAEGTGDAMFGIDLDDEYGIEDIPFDEK